VYYADEVFSQAPKLPVRENEAGKVFVANLTALPVDSFEEFERLYA
jgi:kinesin family member 22